VEIFTQQDFSGGLNLRSDQFQLNDNESPRMLNVEIDPRGGVFSRGAMVRINPTNVAGTWTPQRLTPFYGDSNYVMLSTDVKIYKSTGANFSTLQFSAGNDVTIIAGASPHGAAMAAWGNILYISTGTNAASTNYYWKTGDTYATAMSVSGSGGSPWQGATAAGANHLPRAQHLCVHASKLFAANTNEGGVRQPNRLRWSNELTPDSWHQTNYIDFLGGGDGITAIKVVNGQLVVFKPHATYLLYGKDDSNFQVVEISSSIGASSADCVVASDTGLYFYAVGRGLFFFDGNTIIDAFRNIRPILDLNYVSGTTTDGISLSWVGRRLWLSLPYATSGTIPSYATVNFVLDPSLNAYTMFNTTGASGNPATESYGVIGGTDFRDSSNNELRLMCHPTVPAILNVDDYDVATDSIISTSSFVGFTSYYRTKWFDGGTYMQKKMFRRPDVVVKEASTQQSINVFVYHNFDEAEGNHRRTFALSQIPATVSNWGTMIWGTGTWTAGASSSTVLTGKNLGQAKTVQLEFVGPTSKIWGINSIGYKFNSRRVGG